jgi:Mor family transcriptional regulator
MPERNAETIYQLYCREGKTIREIARQYRCRTATILAIMDAAKIARRRPGRQRAPLPVWDRKKLHQLVRAKGMPYTRAFARRHGVSREKLAVLLGERSLERGRRSQQVALEHDTEIRNAFDARASVNVLATQYGCTRRAISYSLDRTSGNNGK